MPGVRRTTRSPGARLGRSSKCYTVAGCTAVALSMLSFMMKRITRAIWLSLCLAVLGLALVAWFSNPDSMRHHVVEFLVHWMSILGFPATWLAVLAMAYGMRALYELTGVAVPGGLPGLLSYWCILVLAGYLQWFVLVPRSISRVREGRSRRLPSLRREQ